MVVAHAFIVVAMFILVVISVFCGGGLSREPILAIWIVRWARSGAVDFEFFSSWW